MPNSPARDANNVKWLTVSAAIYSLALLLTIGGQSLWTDEAFSAYLACHRSMGTLISTLVHGDSSDLQAVLHYVYLHGWTVLFGSSEVALRAANIPFMALFSFTLVWVSWRVFGSRWLWMVAALLPFVWSYAGEVRAYFALVAFSTVFFGCLLVYLDNPSEKDRRFLPWAVLVSLFLGTAFHMLMLLALPPAMLIALLYARQEKFDGKWIRWKPALLAFSVPFALLFSYLFWTFLRGTAYDYSKPEVLSMGSVLYRLLGLSGYGPNRRFDVSFRPYLIEIAAASLVFLVALAGAAAFALKAKNSLRLVSLMGAFVLGMAEATVLSLVLKMQVDARHLAALTPLIMLSVMAAFGAPQDEPVNQKTRKLAFASAGLLTLLWLVADCRILLLPEYKEEDFRAAVDQAVELHQPNSVDIALVADPVPGAYYGLDLQGAAPCFPLLDDCADGFSKVHWPKRAQAVDALRWTDAEIAAWLDERARQNTPAIVIISTGRHPIVKNSPWWPVLRAKQQAQPTASHGFLVYRLK